MDEFPSNPRAIYINSLQVGQMTTLPLELKWRYTPLRSTFVETWYLSSSGHAFAAVRILCNTTPTKAAPPSPSVGASTRTHSTLLTLSSSLCVKGLTRGCYGWWTKPYKFAPPFLN
jgi:hypothetical protein